MARITIVVKNSGIQKRQNACLIIKTTGQPMHNNSLDNVCAEPEPSDARYLSDLHTVHARHQDFPRTQRKDMVRRRNATETRTIVCKREKGVVEIN